MLALVLLSSLMLRLCRRFAVAHTKSSTTPNSFAYLSRVPPPLEVDCTKVVEAAQTNHSTNDKLLKYLVHKIQTCRHLEEIKFAALVVQEILDSECQHSAFL